MMTPEQAQKKREYDEGLTNLLDTLPRMLWSFYQQLKTEGFNEGQALFLVGNMLSTMFRQRPEGQT